MCDGLFLGYLLPRLEARSRRLGAELLLHFFVLIFMHACTPMRITITPLLFSSPLPREDYDYLSLVGFLYNCSKLHVYLQTRPSNVIAFDF